MANIICIVCPKGCRLTVDENTLAVTGNGCPRGAEYGKNELTHPVRVVTSTVRVEGADICRCPVKTAGTRLCVAETWCWRTCAARAWTSWLRGSCRRRNKGENKKGEGPKPLPFCMQKTTRWASGTKEG